MVSTLNDLFQVSHLFNEVTVELDLVLFEKNAKEKLK
jgi:hypothetical protein